MNLGDAVECTSKKGFVIATNWRFYNSPIVIPKKPLNNASLRNTTHTLSPHPLNIDRALLSSQRESSPDDPSRTSLRKLPALLNPLTMSCVSDMSRFSDSLLVLSAISGKGHPLFHKVMQTTMRPLTRINCVSLITSKHGDLFRGTMTTPSSPSIATILRFALKV